jgi:hypothetical protein
MSPTQSGAQEPPSSKLLRDYQWWVFCFVIICLKFLLLGLDPNPKLFMGDSGSYLWTALSGWIPPDRSFLYGFLIRWVSLTTHSLNSLLILQLFVGASTAILLAFICRQLVLLSIPCSYAAGFVCAIDPLQLVWERYLMTETISLFLYAAMLAFCFYYLRGRRLWQLALVQLLAVSAISFRISYLLVVQATAVILPLIAFVRAPRSRLTHEPRASRARSLGLHLAFSILLMAGLHLGYKELNGLLTGRPPAYLYSSGLSLLATWAPVLKPSDSPDPRLAKIISQGDEFHLTNSQFRNSQLYSKDYLVDRWKHVAADLRLADEVARHTALRALLRRPIGVLNLGYGTFLGYFDLHRLHQQAKSDLGRGDWPAGMTETLATRLRLAPPSRGEAKTYTILQRYFLRAQPYYYVVVLCPVICGAMFFFLREAYVLLLFFHGCIFLGTDSLLAVTASVRYLQPLSFLTILVFAVLGSYTVQRFRPAQRAPIL